MRAESKLIAGVRKLDNGQWQGFVREYGGEIVATAQATRTQWEAAQLAQRLHSAIAYRRRNEG